MKPGGTTNTRAGLEWRLATLALLLAVSVASCALVVSFDGHGVGGNGGNGEEGGTAALFAVRGRIKGLDRTTATLRLVSVSLAAHVSLDVTEGAFAFPALLRDGLEWEVTVADSPTHVCSVSQGKGTISGVEATGVDIACVSNDAALKSLFLGPCSNLSPAFAPEITSYTCTLRTSSLVDLDRTTSVSSTNVTADPSRVGARITVNGTAVEAGKPIPVPLKYGGNPIDIVVTAADQRTQGHYAVVVQVAGSDDPLVMPPGELVKAVAVSGNTLAVVSRSGLVTFLRAYTLVGNAWSDGMLLFAGSPSGSCAPSVAIDGNVVVLGGASDGAHVFIRNGGAWFQSALLAGNWGQVAYAPVPGTVALGTVALAGRTDEPSLVFVHATPTWVQQTSIDVSGVTVPPVCTSVALWADTLAVGSPSGSTDGLHYAVHVFTRSGTEWSQQAYFENPTGADGFGASLALSNDTLAVGAPAELIGTSQTERGAVYVFQRTGLTWSQQAHLTFPSGIAAPTYGGSPLALYVDTLVVGALFERDLTGADTPAVYVLTRGDGTWSERLRITPPKPDHPFGTSLAFWGHKLVVGGERTVYGY
jgi:hypothetical protein